MWRSTGRIAVVVASAGLLVVGLVWAPVASADAGPISSTIPVGSGPVGVAIAPNGESAYVTNMSAGTVSRIRTADDTLQATVGVGTSPVGVAVSPSGSFAYIVNRDSNTVSRIRTADNAVEATISVGSTPFWVAISPDGTFAYVTNVGSNNVTRIRTSDNAVTATIPVGASPYPVAISPDGTFAYVGNFSSNTLSRIRTSDNAVTSTIGVGSGPVGVALSADGSFAFVANQTGGSVSRVRTSDGVVQASIAVGTTPVFVAISPDGAAAYVSNYASANVSRIATATNTVTDTIAVGPRPYGVAISPTGGFAYVANFYADNVSRLEPPGRPLAPSVVARPGRVTVTVTPPVGGAAPSGYKVTSSPQGRTCTITAPDLTCDVTGLTAGSSYSFTAIASNAFGSSASSAPSASITAQRPDVDEVVGWGEGAAGQLGSGVGSSSTVAVPALVGLGGVTQVSAGWRHGCAVASGRAYCWGDNEWGQLGDGTRSDSLTPRRVLGMEGRTVTEVAAGAGHSCAVADGRMYCWGVVDAGRLGIGRNGTDTVTATPVLTSGDLGTSPVTQIAAGYHHTCAISGGRLMCWGVSAGLHYTGAVGAGTDANVFAPLQVRGALEGKTVTAVTAGATRTCAIADGHAYCWGDGRSGGLGTGGTGDEVTPTPVAGQLANRTVTAITTATGDNEEIGHTCAVTAGDVYCWGRGDRGQLGAGTRADSALPVKIAASQLLPRGSARSISAGGLHTCAASGMDLSCWGDGVKGQLGSAKALATTPQAVAVGTSWPVRLSAGSRFTLAALVTAAPGPVRNLVAVEEPGTTPPRMRVTWIRPTTVPAGAALTYTVQTRTSGTAWGAEGVATSEAFGGAIPLGSIVDVRVRISTARDDWPWSQIQVDTRAVTPQAPRNPQATGGSGHATVRWSPPLLTGWSAITSYTVTAAPGGATCTTNGAPSCDIAGLANGTTYTFTVTATNAAGASRASSRTSPVTPMPPPASPPFLTAITAGNTSAQVEFTPPVDTGSAAVTGYDYSVNDGTSWQRPVPAVVTSPLNITGLTNGTAYRVKLRAITMAGPGEESAAITVVPRTTPGPPRTVGATPGRGSAQVSWQAPTSDGGDRITGYRVTALPGGRGCTTTGLLTCEVAGLTNGTAHIFTVVAINAAGTGVPSTPSAPVTPSTFPGSPTGVHAVGGFETATISWAAPPSNGGSPITAYVVHSAGGARVCYSLTGRSCTAHGLPAGVYRFQAQAHNARGVSAWTAPTNYVVVKWTPRPPILGSWLSEVKSLRGALVVHGPRYTVPRGTAITRVALIATQNGHIVANNKFVALPPGLFTLTQRVWFTMSNGRHGVVSRSQWVHVVRYDPVPPPPAVSYEYFSNANIGFPIPAVMVLRRQGNSLKIQESGGGTAPSCFNGAAVAGQFKGWYSPRSQQDPAYVHPSYVTVAFTDISGGLKWDFFTTSGGSRVGGGNGFRFNPSASEASQLRTGVDSCTTG